MPARRFITLDIGSSQLTMAEFVVAKGVGLELTSYAIGSIGIEPGSDADPSAYIVTSIRDMMRKSNISRGRVLMSVSGKDIFPRYVKLPPVTADKIDQIVLYEAQQNVPFPIEEVVWDYQLIEDTKGGQAVMLVAIKTEIAKTLTNCVRAAGLEPQIVDVAPMALYNLVRFNYSNAEGCILVMDMGARSTNLVFIEENRIFSRSIPVAGNTITQELMKEFELPFKDAEELKIAHAFVAFGGAVEGARSQVVNRVSKTVRTVMTRLHAEVSRSINFYRSQQSASKPSVVLLTGGSSIIPETDTFLEEKLGLQVEYLNPFESIAVANRISTEDLSAKIHLLGEVTGLALRSAYSCPMELDLMPPNLVSQRTLRSRIPFLAASASAVILALVCWWTYLWRVRLMVGGHNNTVESMLRTLDNTQRHIDELTQEKQAVAAKADRLMALIRLRTQWIEMIEDIHSRMLEGMWLTEIEPLSQGPGPRTGKPITGLKVTGEGFVDKVKDEEAVGAFGDRLKNTGHFSDEVKVVQILRPSEYSLKFSMEVGLKTPLSF